MAFENVTLLDLELLFLSYNSDDLLVNSFWSSFYRI